ncbi:MAG: orotidine-5'-phosphate decarboxylase [Acidobacteriota bacterium]
MTEASTAKTPAIKTKERIIVALDVETPDAAREIVSDVGNSVGAFKVGLQLFTAAGPGFVRELTAEGHKVFLDLKFHDIPNTVAAASVEAARLGVWMFNVHASGGNEMMSKSSDAVREFCEREGRDKPLMIGVTLLTSSNSDTLRDLGVDTPVEEYVVKLSRDAAASGLDGVVASPMEAAAIRRSIDVDNFIIVTPGIRPNNETSDDQKRVTTPAEALAAGSEYLVIGRPITSAPDRQTAVQKIIEEIDQTK